jgi:tetrahydromethanopterin S-methyltransferase subunit G
MAWMEEEFERVRKEAKVDEMPERVQKYIEQVEQRSRRNYGILKFVVIAVVIGVIYLIFG